MAFGFFAGGGAARPGPDASPRWRALVIYFLLRPTRPWLWLPTGLLVGGALGNLIDRLAHGYVTDFIKLPAWPAFNVSDMAITFGRAEPALRAGGRPLQARASRAESSDAAAEAPGAGDGRRDCGWTASCLSRWARVPGHRR